MQNQRFHFQKLCLIKIFCWFFKPFSRSCSVFYWVPWHLVKFIILTLHFLFLGDPFLQRIDCTCHILSSFYVYLTFSYIFEHIFIHSFSSSILSICSSTTFLILCYLFTSHYIPFRCSHLHFEGKVSFFRRSFLFLSCLHFISFSPLLFLSFRFASINGDQFLRVDYVEIEFT